MATKGVQSLVDNFEFLLLGKGTKYPFRNYISSIDPTTAPPATLIGGSQNVYTKLSGSISVRAGLKRRGTANATQAGVTSSFEWYTSLGDIWPLRVTEENKLQFESDIADGSTLVWYDLMTGLDSTRFVFDTWWDDTLKKDILVMVKFDPNLYSWQGAVAKLASTTVNTIVLDRDAASNGFIPAGTVTINGNAYVYTGVTGSTLTGVTTDPTGEAANSVVISAVVTTSDTPDAGFSNDFIKTIGNQLHVGSYDSRLVYISAFDDFTDYSVPGVRAPGDPDLLTLDSQARGITVQRGSGDVSGNAVISGGLGDWYTVVRSDLTVGTDLTEQVDVTRTTSADLSTALAHEFIDLVGDTVVFIDQNNQLREFGIVRNITNPVFPLLSLDVYTELKDRDLTGGALRVVADEGDTTIYITCPVAGIDYLYQIRQKLDVLGNLTAERLWQPPQVRGISRIAVIDGVSYGHSTTNPQLYQLWNTGQYSDDSPSDEPIPYACHMIIAYLCLKRTRQMLFDKLYFEGYMTPGANVYCSTYLEYQGAKNVLKTTINQPLDPGKKVAVFYQPTTVGVPGENSLGSIPVGQGIQTTDEDNPPKFRAIRRIAAQDVFEAAFDINSESLDSQWEILCMGANMQETDRQPVGIMS